MVNKKVKSFQLLEKSTIFCPNSTVCNSFLPGGTSSRSVEAFKSVEAFLVLILKSSWVNNLKLDVVLFLAKGIFRCMKNFAVPQGRLIKAFLNQLQMSKMDLLAIQICRQ